MNTYIFVPIGSYEQHGPHLPPDTDYLIAKKIVQVISPVFKGKIIDGIKIGISPEHEGFKNTKSISQKEFEIQIEKILSTFPNDDTFFFINAHGGNIKTLNSIHKAYKKKILVLNIISLIKEDLNKLRTSKVGGICHAGEFETSIMLFLYPEMVKMNNLKRTDIKYVPFLDPNFKKEKLKDWNTISFNKSGILGDPYHATAKKGELWFKVLIDRIKSLIKTNII